MNVVEKNNFVDLAKSSKDMCISGPVTNFLATGVFPVDELESELINTFSKHAKIWQSSEVPEGLYFTHGFYIDNAKMKGREFLIEELRRKPNSNRACLSLISMADLVNSGDDPIPSFMILQFSFAGSSYEHLHVTAYFRALEVCNFLPINLAEICDIIECLRGHFTHLKEFTLMIHAFRAYANETFRCLEKGKLEMATPVDISMAVEKKNIPQILEWIDFDLNSSNTVISIDGLNNLHEAFTKCSHDFTPVLKSNVRKACEHTLSIKQLRKKNSYAAEIEELERKLNNTLMDVRNELESSLKGGGR